MAPVKVSVQFYSYFKELTGCAETHEDLAEESTIADLLKALQLRFPKLAGMQNATLIAVGVDYQPRDYKLKNGDQVSLFPPVQGG